MTVEIMGMAYLEKQLNKLAGVPQKHVSAVSRKAMKPVLRQARKEAPRSTGALKKGMKLLGERNRSRGKKVFQVRFAKEMNGTFQTKKRKNGKKTGETVGYYPVSQEYGWQIELKDGRVRIVPGQMFIHNAFNDEIPQIERTIVSEMSKRIDKEIAIRGLR